MRIVVLILKLIEIYRRGQFFGPYIFFWLGCMIFFKLYSLYFFSSSNFLNTLFITFNYLKIVNTCSCLTPLFIEVITAMRSRYCWAGFTAAIKSTSSSCSPENERGSRNYVIDCSARVCGTREMKKLSDYWSPGHIVP